MTSMSATLATTELSKKLVILSSWRRLYNRIWEQPKKNWRFSATKMQATHLAFGSDDDQSNSDP